MGPCGRPGAGCTPGCAVSLPGPGERAYRALLRLYPADFRHEYGSELVELFRHRRDERLAARGRLGVGFWSYVIHDAVGSAWRERRHPNGRRERGDGMLRESVRELGFAARRLLRSPGFSSIALAVLVLGIGVNTTVFTVVNSLLFQPPPFDEPERVFLVLQDSDDGQPTSTSYPAYLDIARDSEVFESVSAFVTREAFLEEDERLAPIRVEYATAPYLDVIGLAPVRGRWFETQEDDVNGQPAAVVSHRWWRERMASDPNVIGSTLRIGGTTIPIVGVGPESFQGGTGPVTTSMWLSISAMAQTGGPAFSLERRSDHPFQVRARLAAGVSLPEAAVAMEALADDLAATYPQFNAERRIHVVPASGLGRATLIDRQVIPGSALVVAVSGLILLVATLNLASLLLVRTASRSKELAVRAAMGAGRGRLLRVVMSEAGVLTVAGGLGGVAAAAVLIRAIRGMSVPGATLLTLDIRMDPTVLMFAGAVSLGTGIVFGLVPALRATSKDVNATLRDASVARLGGRKRLGLNGVLVAGQVAVSLVLLSVGAVFLDTLVQARDANPGFAVERTGYVQVSLRPLDVTGPAAVPVFDQIFERVTAVPAVEAATLALQLPGTQFGTTTQLLGSGTGGIDRPTEIPWNLVRPDYFELMDIPVVHGRTFEPSDVGGPNLLIVSEAMARAYWGRSDVVGEQVRSESAPDAPAEVVGVVADAAVRGLGGPPTPSLYWLYEQGGGGRMNIVFSTVGPPSGAIPAVRAAIRSVDPRILVLTSQTFEDHLGRTLASQRTAVFFLTALGGSALVLALMGIYGLVSFSVERRRQEVGIRIALGAGRESVVALFVRGVATVVVVGAAVGLLLAIPLSGFVGASFLGRSTNATLPILLAGALVVTAMLATAIPALRAARTDPRDVLTRE